MLHRFSGSPITVAMAVGAVISVSVTGTSAQAPATSMTALKTPWGEPDLQGIWTDEFDTPLQRPAKYANQEFFTAGATRRIGRRAIRQYSAGARPSATINGAYNAAAFFSTKPTGRAHVEDRRSAQWPASAADAGGAEGRCRRSRISSRPDAIDRYLQEKLPQLRRREIRSDALAAPRRSPAALHTPDASIATTVRRTARWRSAA